MTFWKALKLLHKGKLQRVSSKAARAYGQDLQTIAYWLCEYENDAKYRSKIFFEFLNAKDWKDEKNEVV